MCVKSSGDSIPPTQLFKMHLLWKVKELTYWGRGNLNMDALKCTKCATTGNKCCIRPTSKIWYICLVCWPCSSTDSTKVWVLKSKTWQHKALFLAAWATDELSGVGSHPGAPLLLATRWLLLWASLEPAWWPVKLKRRGGWQFMK